MAGYGTAQTEVVRGLHQALPPTLLPDSIDGDSCQQMPDRSERPASWDYRAGATARGAVPNAHR
jgi:hypothetical protein